jgi:hypothetical protein
MAPGATTHADEMNARHVELAVTATGGGFTATAPTSAVAPPGYYMLFVLTANGIPSPASRVTSAPDALTGCGGPAARVLSVRLAEPGASWTW